MFPIGNGRESNPVNASINLMCGIIGMAGRDHVQDQLMRGLARMEYRGYDSAGVCIRGSDGLECRKESGKLVHLEHNLAEHALAGFIGIGHTRWATHGAPTRENAHPHLGKDVAVVHNGIIENHEELRRQLYKDGVRFRSQTDSEVIPWLLSGYLDTKKSAEAAWRATVDRLDGAYAIVAIMERDEKRLWFARRGSPLLLGRDGHAVYAASDALALSDMAKELIYLEEGDVGCITLNRCQIWNMRGNEVRRTWRSMPSGVRVSGKDGFSHYMEKEIYEQPHVLAEILRAYVGKHRIIFPDAPLLDTVTLPPRIVMVACGTSYHAALTARYWLERFLQISVEVDVASEYRYRNPVIGPDTWLITLSQSGETADTLEALRLFKSHTPDNPTLALCNVPFSSLARESDGVIHLLAGPEVGVASTKAYTAQLAVLALFALKLAHDCGAMTDDVFDGHLAAMRDVVSGMNVLLQQSRQVSELARLFESVHGSLFLGRGPCYPLALEGALKLKEISYLHAEGYAAGEMKHGPIALIDAHLPVVVLAPRQYHLQKVLSNLREVQARGAKVILLTDLPREDWPAGVDAVIGLPEGDYFTTPLYAAIPLQLLAYYVACIKGTDVDQPRNLAKSVTVE